MRFSFTLCFLYFQVGNAFIRDKTASPILDLGKLVAAQSDHRLSVGLDIGKPGDISRLSISGIVFDLTKEAPNSNDDFVKMPGVHGPKPSLSGGLKTLKIIQDGSFISMAGSETVKPLKGCWEIVWRGGAHSGSLLCGFETEKDYRRNDATLPKGTMYVSFNTWSSEGLKIAQNLKERSAKRAKNALQRKEEELAKMVATNNILQKARHYYNAFSAAEDYFNEPNAKMKLVPSSDEVVRFEGMYVSTEGLVWTEDLSTGKSVVLGTAKMKSVSREV